MMKKRFEVSNGQIIFEKLSTFYSKKDIENWSKKACSDINELFEKYEIYDFKVNKKSYMGIVIECKSKIYNELFIKMVPPMLERFEKEVGTLKLLPKDLTCKIYEVDYEKKAIVMEKIIPGDLVEFYENKEAIFALFNNLSKNKIKIEDDINKNFKDFSEVVEKDYLISKEVKHAFSSEVDELYCKFLESYKIISNDTTKYLLHGDVYKNNMILSDSGIKIIDPLGFKAPFVMELVSICAYGIFYNNTGKSNKEVLDDFVVFFSKFVDEKTYKEALLCELIKVFIPSTYEANDGGIRANKWLSIIKELYPNKI